jgi:hypothetical protein
MRRTGGRWRYVLGITVLLAFAGFRWFDQRGTYELNATPDPANPARPLVPKDLAAALVELDHMLPQELRDEMRRDPDPRLIKYHFSLGLWIRNEWGLWSGSHLAAHLQELGLFHPDDMSVLILESYWLHLRGQPLRIQERVAWFCAYWREREPPPPAICPRSGRDARVTLTLGESDDSPRAIQVADCGHGAFLAYESSRGWYEPDAELLKRIVSPAEPAKPADVPRSVPAQPRPPCEGRGTSIYVRTTRHRLYLCEDGREVGSYVVSLGSNGVAKTEAGDRRTPLGLYELARPRSSPKFGLFIGIGYPNEGQRLLGYTGKDVGIHGPARARAGVREAFVPPATGTSAKRISIIEDWTDGCVATQTDQDMNAVAAWVRRVGPRFVELEEAAVP